MKQTIRVQIRWLILRDVEEFLHIERESYAEPWTEDDLRACLRRRNCIGMVAVHDDRVVGYMVYELEKRSLRLINLAVGPWARRVGVGTQMIEKLVNKLSQQRRTSISLEVRETNLQAQLFFRRMGFVAVGVLPGWYEANGETAYRMQFSIDGSELPYAPVNRIGRHFAGGDEPCCSGS